MRGWHTNMRVKAELCFSGGNLDSVVLSRGDFERLLNGGRVQAPSLSIEREHVDSETIEQSITRLLGQIGVPKHIKGYSYIKDSVALVADDIEYIHKITTCLYPKVAELYNDKASRVERAMRHAIECTWIPHNVMSINDIFNTNYPLESGRPTVGEFIALIAEKVRMIQ